MVLALPRLFNGIQKLLEPYFRFIFSTNSLSKLLMVWSLVRYRKVLLVVPLLLVVRGNILGAQRSRVLVKISTEVVGKTSRQSSAFLFLMLNLFKL